MLLRVLFFYGIILIISQTSQLLAQSSSIRDITDDSSAPMLRVQPTPSSTHARVVARADSQSQNSLPEWEVLQTVLARQRVRSDSLQSILLSQSLKVPADSASRQRYETVVDVAWKILIIWFILVLAYLLWAIHRYAYNYGLSNREWKVLYPEVYETTFDRLFSKWYGAKHGLPDFNTRRQNLIDHKIKVLTLQRQLNDEQDLEAVPSTQIIKPFEEPQKNPYENDSFGLPRGTIRGILALTALVMFLLVEGVNLYAPHDLEHQFDGLVTALEMVLAFYFGSKAVEVLQAKSKAQDKPPDHVNQGEATDSPQIAQIVPEKNVLRTSTSIPVKAPIEEAVMPSSSSTARFANFVVLARDEGPEASDQGREGLARSTGLATRVLALTASFETGRGFPDCFAGTTGNFDGQGLSFGALQWNIGKGTVQPLWKEMRERHEKVLKSMLGGLFEEFSKMLDGKKEDQMRWALGIQHLIPGRSNSWEIAPDWKNALRTLGKAPEMIALQVAQANSLYQVALSYCKDYELTTERGAALMFDIRVQNGSVDRAGAGMKIREDFDLINPILSEEDKQVERMRIVARRRSEVSSAQWRNDVLVRKMTIAEGRGTVHGKIYDIEKEFALGLNALEIATSGKSGTKIA
jgi:hypothetical protein